MRFNILKKTLKLHLIFSLFLIVSLFQACSEAPTPPQPPHLKTQLFSELFSALRQQNYEMALNRITRLRELNSDDVALQTMQVTIQNNLIMEKAQQSLDKDNIDGAIQVINDFSSKYGQTAELRDAVRELNTLKEVKLLLENSITEKAISSAGKKPSTSLIAVENLRAEIDMAWASSSPIVDTLVALLEVASPNDPLPAAYKFSMSKDWENIDLNANYLNSETEFIIFRKFANSSFDASLDKNLRKMTMLSPANFRNMVSKAIMLNLTGDVQTSETMLSQLRTQLKLNDIQYKSLLQLTLQTSSMAEINPLVRYPFFIYCNKNVSMKLK